MKAITAIGIACAFGALFVSAILEGTNPVAFLNIPALILITGGTAGATMASTNFRAFMTAPKAAIMSFKGSSIDSASSIGLMVELSEKARRNGLLALEEDVAKIDDAYTRKGLQLVVDGSEPEVIRNILEVDLHIREQADTRAAKVFEGMGVYSPTLGIIGAVLGLMAVMQNLADPSKLGHGIAAAFVATIYGIGLANLFFLPAASKLKGTIQGQSEAREMVIEGMISIAQGENPRAIESKLQGYLH